jgi:hypothetical protein
MERLRRAAEKCLGMRRRQSTFLRASKSRGLRGAAARISSRRWTVCSPCAFPTPVLARRACMSARPLGKQFVLDKESSSAVGLQFALHVTAAPVASCMKRFTHALCISRKQAAQFTLEKGGVTIACIEESLTLHGMHSAESNGPSFLAWTRASATLTRSCVSSNVRTAVGAPAMCRAGAREQPPGEPPRPMHRQCAGQGRSRSSAPKAAAARAWSTACACGRAR